MSRIGARLREIRKRLNLTQDQFGAKFGLKRSAMGKHERGECSPTIKMLNTLAFQYNVSMDYLLCGRGQLFYKKDEADNEPQLKLDKEMKEMVSLVNRLPLVRHTIMGYFQRFKIENRDLIAKELAQKDG